MQYTTLTLNLDFLKSVQFKLDFDEAGYDLLWVDSQKLMALCKDQNTPMVPDSRLWSTDRFDNVMSGFINSNRKGYELPLVQLHLNYKAEGLISKAKRKLGMKVHEDDLAYIGFSDGRHRTRLLYDLGVKRIPVVADKVNQEKLIELTSGSFEE